MEHGIVSPEEIVRNQIAVSAVSAISPDDKMPDKADWRDQSVSLSGSSVDAKDEGEGSRNQIMRTRYCTLWWKKTNARDN